MAHCHGHHMTLSGHLSPSFQREESNRRASHFMSCSVRAHQVVQVLSWVSLEDMRSWVEWPRGLKTGKTGDSKALDDESSYGFGAGTKCLCLPLHALISKPPGTADLGLGALSLPRVFILCFILCMDFLMEQKDQEYQSALPDTV